MIVRPVGAEDVDTWNRLRLALWPDADRADLEASARALLAGGGRNVDAAFLAFADDGTPAGFAELSIRSYVPDAASIAGPFLEGWYVEPAYRDRGVGRALVEAGEGWARGRGYRQLGSDAELDNTLSHGAHRALGFREVERAIHYIKDLDARG